MNKVQLYITNQATSMLLHPVTDKQSNWPVFGPKYFFYCEMLVALIFRRIINHRAGTLRFGGTSELHVLAKRDYQKLCSESRISLENKCINYKVKLTQVLVCQNLTLILAYFWYVHRKVKSLKPCCTHLSTDFQQPLG